ncbi:hypothetical protein FACS1894113_4620 [Alphaproteobacteria bacterium]|nr:hypothetical protein FACS1894113_4620 [Alphaproteobacteria bacterium]
MLPIRENLKTVLVLKKKTIKILSEHINTLNPINYNAIEEKFCTESNPWLAKKVRGLTGDLEWIMLGVKTIHCVPICIDEIDTIVKCPDKFIEFYNLFFRFGEECKTENSAGLMLSVLALEQFSYLNKHAELKSIFINMVEVLYARDKRCQNALKVYELTQKISNDIGRAMQPLSASVDIFVDSRNSDNELDRFNQILTIHLEDFEALLQDTLTSVRNLKEKLN